MTQRRRGQEDQVFHSAHYVSIKV